MTAPDQQIIILYRAIADYSDVIREAAKARAAQKALADDQARFTGQQIKSDADAAASRRRYTIEVEQQSGRQVESTRKATTASRDMWAAISAQVDKLQDSRRSLLDHTRALDVDAQATTKARLNWEVFTATMRDQTAALAANRNGLMANIRAAASAPGLPAVPGGGGGGVGPTTQSINQLHHAAQRASGSIGSLSNLITQLRRNAASGGGGRGAFDILLRGFGELGTKIGSSLAGAAKHVLSFRFLLVALIASLGPVIAVLGSLGAAAIGVGNTLISLAGSVAALPGLFFAAATGISALVVALGPVANVFKLFKQNQEAAASGGRDLAAAQRQAADRVRNAERAYRSASQGIIDAQYEERRAQEALNDARRDALRDLEDLRRELARSTLNEESAILSLKEAQDAYLRTLADPDADALQRERALLRIREAEFDLGDVRARNVRLAEDAAEAEARGVEGSQQVVDARRSAELATRGVADAVLRLEDATRDLADAQTQSNAGASGGVTAADKLAAALAKLSPSTRAFVLGLFAMSDAWEKIKTQVSEALFRPLVGQLGNLRSLLPTINLLLTTAAAAIGAVAARGIEMVSSGPWKADFATLAGSNARIITSLGNAGLAVADAFRHIAIAAAPFTEWIAGAIERTAAGFRDWAQGARDSGAIADFLETTADRLSQVWRIIKNVGSAIWSLFTASEDFTSWFLDRVESVTKGWKDWSKAQEGATSPFKKWLEDVKPLLSDVWGLFKEVVKTFAEMASDPRNIKEAREILKTLADDILPKIKEIFGELSESGVISSLFGALSDFLGAVKDFLDAGGGNALKAFVGALGVITGFFATVMENDQAAAVIAGVAVALGVLAGAAAIAKFTGLFALAGILKTIYINALLVRGVGLGSIVAGAGGTAAAGGAGAAAGRGGVVSRILGAFASPGSTIARPLYVFVVNNLPGSPAVPGAPGTPGAPGAKPVGVLGGIARVAAPVAAATVVLDSASDLINKPETRADPSKFTSLVSPAQGTIQPLLSWIGQNIIAPLAPEGSRFANPENFSPESFAVTSEDWDNLGRFIKEDVWEPITGLFYDLGFDLGEAVDVSADWVHDNILVPAGTWFNSVRDSITSRVEEAATFANDNIVQPAFEWLAPFGDIFRGVRDAAVFYAGQAGTWVHDNVVVHLTNLLSGLGQRFNSVTSNVGPWVQNTVVAGAINLVTTIGQRIGSAASNVGAWIQNTVIPGAINFFVGIGRGIASAASSAGSWIQSYIVNPVVNFFSAIGRFIANIPGRIRSWAETLPIIGPFVRAQGLQSGGLIGGRRDGVVDGVPLWATVGEFMVRKRVVDKPGGRDLLTALNEERIDPAALYAALNLVAQQVNIPLQVPADVRGPTTNVVQNTRNAGMSFGDVIINNPAVERANTSLRRSLQTLAYMTDR